MAGCQNPLPNPYLAYLPLGWSTLPILPDGKLPDTDLLPKIWDEEIGARRHSWKPFQQTRAGAIQTRIWFTRRPQGNVGIVTGQVSGLIVLDLDGAAAVVDAKDRGLPHTPTVRTAKGLHLYLKYPMRRGRKVTNRANLLEGNPPGYDIRGDGGYVVCPPSRHPSGYLYQWEISPAEAELAEVPAWLLLLLEASPTRVPQATSEDLCPDSELSADPLGTAREQAYGARALQGELDELALAQEGERNHRLNRAAFKLGQLVGGRVLSEEEVSKGLLAVAMGTGLPQGEALKTIESGLQAGKKYPRQVPDLAEEQERL